MNSFALLSLHFCPPEKASTQSAPGTRRRQATIVDMGHRVDWKSAAN